MSKTAESDKWQYVECNTAYYSQSAKAMLPRVKQMHYPIQTVSQINNIQLSDDDTIIYFIVNRFNVLVERGYLDNESQQLEHIKLLISGKDACSVILVSATYDKETKVIIDYDSCNTKNIKKVIELPKRNCATIICCFNNSNIFSPKPFPPLYPSGYRVNFSQTKLENCLLVDYLEEVEESELNKAEAKQETEIDKSDSNTIVVEKERIQSTCILLFVCFLFIIHVIIVYPLSFVLIVL